MEEKQFERLKDLVFAAVDAKTTRPLSTHTATNSFDKIKDRDLRDLGVQPSQVDGIWTLINGNIKDEVPKLKRVEAKDREGVKTAGDIWKKVCAANGVDQANKRLEAIA